MGLVASIRCRWFSCESRPGGRALFPDVVCSRMTVLVVVRVMAEPVLQSVSAQRRGRHRVLRHSYSLSRQQCEIGLEWVEVVGVYRQTNVARLNPGSV